jgi:cytoplasmic iron level regulating protein YaaA (DUF328/UPF0246 family)
MKQASYLDYYGMVYDLLEAQKLDKVNQYNLASHVVEAIIDIIGIDNTLETLSDIANHKASHIDTNWQDRYLAKAWQRIASRLDKIKFDC